MGGNSKTGIKQIKTDPNKDKKETPKKAKGKVENAFQEDEAPYVPIMSTSAPGPLRKRTHED